MNTKQMLSQFVRSVKNMLTHGAKKNIVHDTPPESAIHMDEDAVHTTTPKDVTRSADEDGYSPLFSSVALGNYEVAVLLLNQGADINARDTGDKFCGTILQEMVRLNKPEAVKFLLAHGADVHIVDDEDKWTLLHWAARIGVADEIIDMLLQSGCDPNSETTDGLTALTIAIIAEHKSIAEKLLPVTENVDARYENTTALELAMKKKYIDLEKILLKKTLEKRGAEVAAGLTVKEYQRQEKKKLLEEGSLTPLSAVGGRPTSPQVIESILYLGTYTTEKSILFKGQADNIYTSCKTLHPLMDIMALAGLGKHDAGIDSSTGKKKVFKIIGLTKSCSVNQLRVVQKAEASGLYAGKNTAFASFGGGCERLMYGTIMHEGAHFVMREVFKNGLNPFSTEDEDAKKTMQAAIDAIHNRLSSMKKEKRYEQYAFEAINSVFEEYPEKEWAGELAVKLPQIVGAIGVKLASKWMGKNVPELINFHYRCINPKMIAYLQAHHVGDYLMVDTSVYDELLKKSDEKLTDVKVAADKGDIATVKSLLSGGGISDEGFKALRAVAVYTKYKELRDFLCSLPEMEKFKPSDLELAASDGDVVTVKRLLSGGGISDEVWQKIGPIAVYQGHKEIVDLLFSSPYIERLTPITKAQILNAASLNDNSDVVAFILDRAGKDIDSSYKDCVFEEIATYGLEKIADVFLAREEIPDDDKGIHLMLAIQGFHHELAEKLWTRWQGQLDLRTKINAAKAAVCVGDAQLSELILRDPSFAVPVEQFKQSIQPACSSESSGIKL